jgi:hypothetical protein
VLFWLVTTLLLTLLMMHCRLRLMAAGGGPQDSHVLSIRRSSTNSCNGSTASDADSLPAAAHVRD